jgi:hypothetical protein
MRNDQWRKQLDKNSDHKWTTTPCKVEGKGDAKEQRAPGRENPNRSKEPLTIKGETNPEEVERRGNKTSA